MKAYKEKSSKQDEELVVIDLKDFSGDKEKIIIIREGAGNDGVHVLALNRQIIDGLIRECKVKGGINNNINGKTNKKKTRQKEATPTESKFKAIETTTCHVCPNCNAEAEVRWKVEVQEDGRQRQQHSGGWGNHLDNIVKYLQRHNSTGAGTKNQDKRVQTLVQEKLQLEQENQQLEEANSAAKEAYEALNHFVKKKTTENTQLKQMQEEKSKEDAQAAAAWKLRWQEQREENVVLQNAVEQLRVKYRTISRQLREICPTPSFKL